MDATTDLTCILYETPDDGAQDAQDAQGRDVAMQNAFHLHQLAHTHWLKLYDFLLDPTGLPESTRKALGIGPGEA